MGAKKFNGMVFERIQKVIDAGEDEERDRRDILLDPLMGGWNPRCNFTGTVFPYNIYLYEFIEEGDSFPPINFTKSIFLGKTSFRKVRFEGSTYFNETKFHDIAIFADAIFVSDVEFENSQIYEYAIFTNTFFLGETSFLATEAKKQIHFEQARFKKNVKFNAMKFNAPIYFDRAKFLYKNEEVSFKYAIFHDYSNFEHTKFNGGADFNLAFFKEWAYFRNAEFDKETSFAGAISKETVLMESVDLSNLKFAETNIESFKFIDCSWSEERFAKIYDEKHQIDSNCSDTTLAEIYRRLKKIARESADEEQTSHWHYREKEMTRRVVDSAFYFPTLPVSLICILLLFTSYLFSISYDYHPSTLNAYLEKTFLLLPLIPILIQYRNFKNKTKNCQISKNWFSKIYLNVYHFISGYGEKPIKAGLLLFALIILPFCIQLAFSITPNGPKDWIKGAMWYMPLIKIKFDEAVGYQYLLKGISVTLITLQAALFGFALRNKLRR
ncbi:pentapeptide repeat-containing protein [Maridesulfovibrio salexigens]|uniref:Pentapeptide repeat-containing protein n=1 Tax=Maridesulfovibrio salexigens (strain ATCC 14822 / DSM 2638 / NCIMB 8403 / VKM B-1763) TaxID=526222 RepID=C6BSE6_MARSD|nr:pentapeptide repeat-containing protein [Maridesulfovibrio salexigens]ACS79622.1 hypothetical protein Desal_1560 [Maridesulfovibrio salexigens DSM 2638]